MCLQSFKKAVLKSMKIGIFKFAIDLVQNFIPQITQFINDTIKDILDFNFNLSGVIDFGCKFFSHESKVTFDALFV